MPTHLEIRDREFEERYVVYGPSMVVAGLVASAVLATLTPAFLWVGLLLVGAGIGRWVLESIRMDPDLVTVHPEYREQGDIWHHPSSYWWGAAFVSFSLFVGVGAAFRALHAHGVLEPGATHPVHLGLGHATTVVVGLGLLASLWAAREARQGGRIATSLGAVTAIVLAGGVLLVLQSAHLLDRLDPAGTDAPPLAVLFWIHALIAAWFAGVALSMIVVAARAAAGHVPAGSLGVVSALLLAWTVASVAWLLVYLTLHLDLLAFSGRLF